MSNSKPFNETWAYPADLKTKLLAISYDVRPLNEAFRSGRSKFECVFRGSEQRVVARRLAMCLTSKAGLPYYVCLRDEPKAAPARPTTSFADENSAPDPVIAA
jgi:hypothetical protein